MDADIARDEEPPEAPWEKAFLAELRERGNIRAACIAATAAGFKIGRSSAFAWKKKRTPFRLAWNEIMEVQLDELEYSAWKRATAGVRTPIVFRGHQLKDADGKPMFKVEYSDRLAEFFLATRRPGKYAQRRFIGIDANARDVTPNTSGAEDADVTPRERAERLRAAMREIWDATAVPPPPETDGPTNGNGASHGPPWTSTNGTNGSTPNGAT